MSRLYETLERINRIHQQKKGHEVLNTSPGPLPHHNTGGRRRISLRLVLTVLILTICTGGILFTIYMGPYLAPVMKQMKGLVSFSAPRDADVKTGVKKRGKEPSPAPSKPEATAAASNDAVKLNERAVELLKKGVYWEALYLLDEAIQIAPDLKAPYYNTVYALVQLGYHGAAGAYCRQIIRLFGETDWLRRNREALEALGIDMDMAGGRG